MRKLVYAFAILAAAASTAAVAKDLKQEKRAAAPTVSSAAQMSDAEMDRVIGGFGFGLTTAETGSGTAPPAATFLLDLGNAVFHPGYGNSTAISTGHYNPFH
jgi:hypothetical protein